MKEVSGTFVRATFRATATDIFHTSQLRMGLDSCVCYDSVWLVGRKLNRLLIFFLLFLLTVPIVHGEVEIEVFNDEVFRVAKSSQSTFFVFEKSFNVTVPPYENCTVNLNVDGFAPSVIHEVSVYLNQTLVLGAKFPEGVPNVKETKVALVSPNNYSGHLIILGWTNQTTFEGKFTLYFCIERVHETSPFDFLFYGLSFQLWMLIPVIIGIAVVLLIRHRRRKD